MKIYKFVFIALSLIAMQYANAASMEFLHPRDSDSVRSSFQLVARLLDSPPGREVTVVIVARDTETGNVATFNVINIPSPGRKDMLIQRIDLPDTQKGRETNITV